MRFLIIFTLCFLLIACSTSRDIETEKAETVIASPIALPTIEAKNSLLETFKCTNTKQIIGTTDISFDDKTILNFYEKPVVSQSPAQTLRFFEDKELKMFSFKAEGEKSYNRLRPEFHKLDYFIFDLPVKSRMSGWLEIIADDQTNKTLWIQESKDVKFKDWLQQMKTSFAVGRLNKEANQILTKPDLKAEKIIFDGDESFKVIEMKGDWIKVESQNEPSKNNKSIVSGWIRWRDENGCLIVEIFPFA